MCTILVEDLYGVVWVMVVTPHGQTISIVCLTTEDHPPSCDSLNETSAGYDDVLKEMMSLLEALILVAGNQQQCNSDRS